MRIKIWQLVVVILLLVNTIVLAMLWFGRKDAIKPPPGGNARAYLVQELALTNRQVKQYDELREQHFSKMQQLMQEIRETRDRFFDNISSSTVDTATVSGLAKELSEKEAEKERVTLYHFRTVRGLLSEEQKQRFDKVIKDVLRMMGRPPGPGHRGRAGDRLPGEGPPPPRNEDR